MGHPLLSAWPSVPCTTTRTWICALPWNLKPLRKTSAVKPRMPGKVFGPLSKSDRHGSRGASILKKVPDTFPWVLEEVLARDAEHTRQQGSSQKEGRPRFSVMV